MKLDEIHLVGSHDFKRYSYEDFDADNSTKIGFSEGGTVIRRSVARKDARVVMFSLHDTDGELLSSVVGYPHTIDQTEYFVVLDVFTASNYRRKGYAIALYTSLVKKYGLKLMSDKKQTSDGKDLWSAIGQVLDVSVLDASTGEKLSRSEVPNQQVYITEPDRYLLIAEHTESLIETVGDVTIGDGIVDDYMIYTHPDNEGKYE